MSMIINLDSYCMFRIGNKIYTREQIVDRIEKIEELEKRIIVLENKIIENKIIEALNSK